MMSVSEDMRIQMADGSSRGISTIKIGDSIYDEQHGAALVTNVLHGIEECIYLIKLSNNSALKATEDHPVLTENGFKRIMDLKVGDVILSADGKNTLQNIEIIQSESVVYNLILETESNLIICEDISVGDFSMQQTLSR